MTDVIASDQLRILIERIERLEEEKKGIADDIKGVYAEAKSTGFDVKTMRAIVQLRKMDVNTRREAEALLDTYKAALGMLDGTPLGHWALERLSKKQAPDSEVPAPAETDTVAAPEPTIEEASAMGQEAARAGAPVTANPFPARDVRRAAWDEAWCKELGSDGMDIPDALKPAPKAAKGNEPDDAGQGPKGGQA